MLVSIKATRVKEGREVSYRPLTGIWHLTDIEGIEESCLVGIYTTDHFLLPVEGASQDSRNHSGQGHHDHGGTRQP